MSWRREEPGHQQQRYWLCRMNRSLSSIGKDFSYQCYFNVYQYKKQIFNIERVDLLYPRTTKLLGVILVSLCLSVHLSVPHPMSALMSRPDPAVLSVGTLHSLEWFWVSRRIFIYSHHNTFVFFSKTSVCLSIHPSVHPSGIPCPLCRAYSSGWIHLIFLHLIKQLQKVGCVQSCVQKFKIWIFANF